LSASNHCKLQIGQCKFATCALQFSICILSDERSKRRIHCWRKGERRYNRHSLPTLLPGDANLCANASACPSRILSQNRTHSLRDVFYLVGGTMSYVVIAANVGAEIRVFPATRVFAASPNRASFGECRA